MGAIRGAAVDGAALAGELAQQVLQTGLVMGDHAQEYVASGVVCAGILQKLWTLREGARVV